MIKTEIGQTTTDRITVRGYDLATELIGRIDFIDMLMLVTVGRKCQGNEKDMLNTILVTVTDHGLTPSALAARLTYMGAPEAPQAAVAAGLLGAGSVFLGAMQDAAIMLKDAAGDLTDSSSDEEIEKAARAFVSGRRASRQPLYGLGHNIHIDGDPRIPALKAVTERNGYYGLYWKLLLAMDDVSGSIYSRRLPANTAGAVGAMILSMDLPVHLARGLALVGRCAGLLGHIIEEEESPTGQELWDLVLRQDERNKLPEPKR
ncbi:citryl-CoA lyase [Arthrobacter sp. I2-34]|uniref:citrate synthase (unknown stereospecificity) n=1 Tax=Arthrobacter hankyongi TaxID=2904801 RepID=A0ABS9L3V3_9MICC|nr:citryl-CoA lyase [Arthrobacter hankyongi]MCG2621338.1 citryl-CoA lyase [Arthrobacter hankyongi]